MSDPTTTEAPAVVHTSGDSPLKPSAQRHSQYSSETTNHLSFERRLAMQDTSQKFVEVDYDRMLRELPEPTPHEQPPDFTGAFDRVPAKPDTEKVLVDAFARCIKDAAAMIPGYQFDVIGDTPDKDDKRKEKVDAALYLKSSRVNKSDKSQRWALQAMHFEFKRSQDAFASNSDASTIETDAEEYAKVRMQIISYAGKVFSRQQRTFCFSALVVGCEIRILRWDRAGVIVTAAFNYRDDPQKLGEFLRRFCRLRDRPELQGHDPTAQRIPKGSSEWNMMKNVAAERCAKDPKDHAAQFFKKSLNESWPWWKLRVDESVPPFTSGKAGPNRRSAKQGKSVEGKFHYCLVGKPHFGEHSGMVGRGTRCYVAYDCEKKDFVLLKDAWRVDLPGIEREGDTLAKLNEAGVRHVPTLAYHGDVLRQTTITRDVWLEQHGFSEEDIADLRGKDRPRIKRHTHYRLAVLEIGRQIKEFGNGKHLIKIIIHCLIAHKDAYEKCGLIHRDISAGNILIVYAGAVKVGSKVYHNWVGMLADWELSKPVYRDEELTIARQPDRTGTWQFLSCYLLQDRTRRVKLPDEFESTFNVLLWTGAQLMPNNIINLNEFMYEYFDAYRSGLHNEMTCGAVKSSSMKSGTIYPGDTELVFYTQPFDALVKRLLQLFRSRYALEDSGNLQQAVNVTQDSKKPSQFGINPDELPPDPDSPPESPVSDEAPQVVTIHVDASALAEHQENLAILNSHDKMIELLNGFVREKGWPRIDKIESDFQTDFKYDRSKRKTTSTMFSTTLDSVQEGVEHLEIRDRAEAEAALPSPAATLCSSPDPTPAAKKSRSRDLSTETSTRPAPAPASPPDAPAIAGPSRARTRTPPPTDRRLRSHTSAERTQTQLVAPEATRGRGAPTAGRGGRGAGGRGGRGAGRGAGRGV